MLGVYASFRRKMSAAGLAQRDHEGAMASAMRIKTQRPELAVDIEAITELYCEMRYGVLRQDQNLPELRRRVRSLKV